MSCPPDIKTIGPKGWGGVDGTTGEVGASDLTGPAGPIIPIGTIIFDGGLPSTDFTPGPNFDCGGVN